MWLFVLFLFIPLIEIGLFIQVGGLIGLWPTLAIVVLTAVGGTALMQREGRQAMGDLNVAMREFRDPSRPMAHGAMILFAGALLLTPGFFTDAMGLALLVPGVRDWVMTRIGRRVTVVGGFGGAAGRGGAGGPGDVIDGDYHPVDDDPRDLPSGRGHSEGRGASGWTRD